MRVRLAGHIFSIEGEPQIRQLEAAGGFGAFGCGPSSVGGEWKLIFGEGRGETVTDLIHTFTLDDGKTLCRFGKGGPGGLSYIFEIGDGIRMSFDGGDTVRASADPASGYVKFAAWMAFAMLSASSGISAVHSSTIVREGRAVMMLGESGTGKSTHTALWLKHIPGTTLLNDDSPLLSVEGGKPVVFGSPWSGKTPCYKAESYPLAAIVRLSQAPHNSIVRCGTLDAISALFPSLPPAFAGDEALTDSLMKIVSTTVGSVPVFRMECLPDEDAARTCCEAVFAQPQN